MILACVLVFLLVISSASSQQPIIYKWNICPSVTENSLPTTCSSLIKNFNTSSDLIDGFNAVFFKSLNDDISVDDAFDASIPVSVISQLVYDVLKNDGQAVGILNPEDGANLISETIEDTLQNFTPALYAEILGRSAGQYLLSEGVLTEENMASFATAFADSLVTALEEKPSTVMHGLHNAVVRYFTPMGLYTPEKWDIWHSHCIYNTYKIARRS